MFILWFKFLLCSAVIIYCGTKLSRYGDVIAEKTGLGRAWIGLILVSSVTSLPELFIGLSSVTVAKTPDIAMGDIMGSCVFNLALIALLDILHGPGPIFAKAEHGHIISAGFGIILIGFACLSLLAGRSLPPLGHVGLYVPAIIAIYAIGVRRIFLFEKRRLDKFADEMAKTIQYDHLPLKMAVVNYVAFAVVIIAAAVWLPVVGDELARATGLGDSFMGTVLIAMTTSLPEMVVSVSALRIGATDMAIANLFGSNMFNLVILAVDDIFYLPGPLLWDVSSNHLVTGFIAVVMAGIAIVSLTYRLEKKTMLRLSWDAVAILLAYVLNVYLAFVLRRIS